MAKGIKHNWKSQECHLDPFQSSYRPQDQLFKQLFVSISFVAQLCHCHHQGENVNYHLLLRENWSGWSRVKEKKKHQKAGLQWTRSCWKTGVSVHSRDLKVRLKSLLLITWTKNLLEQSSVVRWKKNTAKHGSDSIMLWGCLLPVDLVLPRA